MPFSEDYVPEERDLSPDSEMDLNELFNNVLDAFSDRQPLIRILRLAYSQGTDWLMRALNVSHGNRQRAVELVSDELRKELRDIFTEFVNSRGADNRKEILSRLIDNFNISSVSPELALAADIYFNRLAHPSRDSFPDGSVARLNRLK